MKTIAVSDETHKTLADLGKKSETYEEIILRLIESYEKGRRKGE